jgi:hypothetical protein
MTFTEAADALSSTVAGMRAHVGGRLRGFFLFQGRDQRASGSSTNREHYFGGLRADQTDKPFYSAAVRSLLAAW